jgi:hypothetical protein
MLLLIWQEAYLTWSDPEAAIPNRSFSVCCIQIRNGVESGRGIKYIIATLF